MITDEILEGLDPDERTGLAGELKQATIVRIQNVADYLMTGTDQEYWDVRVDFPNCAPPWTCAWFEWRTPEFSRSCELGTQRLTPGVNGVLVVVLHHCEGVWIVGSAHYTRIDSLASVYLGASLRAVDAEGAIVTDPDHPMVERLNRMMNMPTHDDGIGCKAMPFTAGSKLVETGLFQPRDLARFAATQEHIVLLATSFAHCKNVRHVTERIPLPLQKKRATHGRFPVTRHVTLEIAPMTRIVNQARRGGATTAQALHIVRGHFKHFGPERPLLGKHVGTYWWGMHTAGSRSAGEVIKDYSITPKKGG